MQQHANGSALGLSDPRNRLWPVMSVVIEQSSRFGGVEPSGEGPPATVLGVTGQAGFGTEPSNADRVEHVVFDVAVHVQVRLIAGD